MRRKYSLLFQVFFFKFKLYGRIFKRLLELQRGEEEEEEKWSERVREREREGERKFLHLLGQFPKSHNGQVWTKLGAGAKELLLGLSHGCRGVSTFWHSG